MTSTDAFAPPPAVSSLGERAQQRQFPRRVVVVTGGSRGIGASVVDACLGDGWAVCFTYTHDSAGARDMLSRHRGAPVLAVRADVTDHEATAHVYAEASTLGDVTALVNNAGSTGPLGSFVDTDIVDIRRTVDINLIGPLLTTRYFVQQWMSRPQGRTVINVSSIAAALGAPGEYIPYAAAKAGVETLTIGLAKELGPVGIRVNAVRPGTTVTEIHALAGDPERPGRVASRIPMGRPAQPGEIGGAVRWLLSPEASYVSGAILNVAGGL